MPDLFEAANGTDPARADSGEDLDGDGFDNVAEYRLGSSPDSSASSPIDFICVSGTLGTEFDITGTWSVQEISDPRLEGVGRGGVVRIVPLSRVAQSPESRRVSMAFRHSLPAGDYPIVADLPEVGPAPAGVFRVRAPVIDRVFPEFARPGRHGPRGGTLVRSEAAAGVPRGPGHRPAVSMPGPPAPLRSPLRRKPPRVRAAESLRGAWGRGHPDPRGRNRYGDHRSSNGSEAYRCRLVHYREARR